MGSKTTKTTSEPPKFQQPFLEGLFERAQTAADTVQGQPIFAARGADQLIADQLTRESAVGAQGVGEGTGDIADLFTQQVLGGSVIDPSLTGTSARDEALNAITAPLQQNLLENLIPQFQSSTIRAGAEGGARERINLAQLVEQGFTRSALEARSNLTFQDLLSRRNLATQEAGLEQSQAQLIPQLQQMAVQLGLLPAQLLDLVGQRGQAERQSTLDAAVQQPFVGLPELSAVIQNSIGGQTTSTSGGGVINDLIDFAGPFGAIFN